MVHRKARIEQLNRRAGELLEYNQRIVEENSQLLRLVAERKGELARLDAAKNLGIIWLASNLSQAEVRQIESLQWQARLEGIQAAALGRQRALAIRRRRSGPSPSGRAP